MHSNAYFLKPFQDEGVEFLIKIAPEFPKPHKILCFECGTGKTVVASAAAKRVRAKSILLLCPVSVKENWRQHLIDWGGYSSDEIFIVWKKADVIPKSARIIIISYELILDDFIQIQLRSRRYAICIVDEAHRLKNAKGKRAYAFMAGDDPIIGHARFKWLLSATIMPNRPFELYLPLRVLASELMGPYINKHDFGMRFCGGYFNKDKWEYDYSGSSNEEELRERIGPLILTKTIEEAFPDMPPVLQETVYLNVDHDAQWFYDSLDENNTPSPTLRKELSSMKLDPVSEYIEDWLVNNDEKLMAFVFHRQMVEHLARRFGDRCVFLYGGISEKQRNEAKRRFIEDPLVKLLVGQTTSASEAIDGFQRVCNNLLLVEAPWSGLDQIVGRLRRHGQYKPIYVVNLVVKRTLDDPIRFGLVKKKRQTDLVLGITHKKEGTQMVDGLFERAVVALEAIAASLPKAGWGSAEGDVGTAAPAAKDAAKPATKAKAAKVTAEDARKAAQEMLVRFSDQKAGNAFVKAALTKAGAKKFADLTDVTKINNLVAELNAAEENLAEEVGDDLDLDALG